MKIDYNITIGKGQEKTPIKAISEQLEMLSILMDSIRKDTMPNQKALQFAASSFGNGSMTARLKSNEDYDVKHLPKYHKNAHDLFSGRQPSNLSYITIKRAIKLAESIEPEYPLLIKNAANDTLWKIDSNMADILRSQLKQEYHYLGSAEGYIKSINIDKKQIEIHEILDGYVIKGTYQQEHLQDILIAIENNETTLLQLSGNITADPYKKTITQIEIEQLQTSSTKKIQGLIEKYAGSNPNITQGLSTEDYLQEIRKDRYG